ncbi:uncharacterized protein LOC109819113 isoform X1 [Cajanus cajan]|uniref:uncharacterized protein LOC109819113 isoform X1 n=1 Tax=Cajanus cajan TaxID=3821 RepID=UPI00098DBC91|nr:uncharacterized protein LOC109819113 isoform X1 [Cajanus cajan]
MTLHTLYWTEAPWKTRASIFLIQSLYWLVETATDAGYAAILGVIRHEIMTGAYFLSMMQYFHKWTGNRYDEIESKMVPFLKQSGYNVKKANPVPAITEFVAQLAIFELLDNAIFIAGYKVVLHIHSVKCCW